MSERPPKKKDILSANYELVKRLLIDFKTIDGLMYALMKQGITISRPIISKFVVEDKTLNEIYQSNKSQKEKERKKIKEAVIKDIEENSHLTQKEIAEKNNTNQGLVSRAKRE
jgi:hypothetical protein